MVIAQLLLGAAFRHNATGIIPHITGAIIVTTALFYEGISIMTAHAAHKPLNRAAGIMVSVVGAQLMLGLGAYVAKTSFAASGRTEGWMVLSTVAHVAGGALALASSIATAIQIYRHVPRAAAIGAAHSKQATA